MLDWLCPPNSIHIKDLIPIIAALIAAGVGVWAAVTAFRGVSIRIKHETRKDALERIAAGAAILEEITVRAKFVRLAFQYLVARSDANRYLDFCRQSLNDETMQQAEGIRQTCERGWNSIAKVARHQRKDIANKLSMLEEAYISIREARSIVDAAEPHHSVQGPLYAKAYNLAYLVLSMGVSIDWNRVRVGNPDLWEAIVNKMRTAQVDPRTIDM